MLNNFKLDLIIGYLIPGYNQKCSPIDTLYYFRIRLQFEKCKRKRK